MRVLAFRKRLSVPKKKKEKKVTEKEKKGSVKIPKGKYGTAITYMYHSQITADSDQLDLINRAEKDGKRKKSPEYYSLIDNRIAIATKENIGNKLKVTIGSYVDVDFKYTKNQKIGKKKVKKGQAKTYKCIIGDDKGDDATNPWGHDNGRTVVEMLYYDKKCPKKVKNNPWGVGKVIMIRKIGKKYKY